MTHLSPNSVQARDIASIVHPQTNLATHLEQGPMVIERGHGCYVYDDSGTQFLDAAAGLWCASLGYASERLARVAYEQMRKLGYYHLYRGTTNEQGVDLAEKLLQIAPQAYLGPMSKVLLQCSGSEANDTAIKLVWYYHAAIGKPEKRKIIGRRMGYHGSTSASISASGKADMHADFGLPFPGFLHTEYPHYYRHHHDGETEEQFAPAWPRRWKQLIEAEGPETCAAFIAEPVMGAGGGLTPPRSYWEKMQAVIRKYDMLFIADEVICGFGRTGNMWGSQTYDLRPDMITCAKALSAGMQPISALLINQRDIRGDAGRKPQAGEFRARLHLCRASGDDGRGDGDAAYLRRDRHDRPRAARRPASCRKRCGASPIIRWSARCAASGCCAASNWCRTKRRGGRSIRRARLGATVDRYARDAGADHAVHRRPHRVLAAADHHRGGDRRDGGPLAARAG